MFIPSSKVIIHHPSDRNKILLVRRTVNGAIYYEPAGGKLEYDALCKTAETLEECAIREVHEELGLVVRIEEYIGSYYFFWLIDEKKGSSCAVFTATIVDQDTNFKGNSDTCELPIEQAWVTVDDILNKKISIDPMYVGLEKVLMDYCMSMQRSEK